MSGKIFHFLRLSKSLNMLNLPSRPPENSRLKATHSDKQHDPKHAILTEGDGSDEGRDDWRIPRRHTHQQGMAEWVCSDLLSPQVSPSVGLQRLLGGGVRALGL